LGRIYLFNRNIVPAQVDSMQQECITKYFHVDVKAFITKHLSTISIKD